MTVISSTNTFSISDLSKEFDITTRTIRFYEDKGLISPLREGQKRIYSQRDRVRLKLILRGKRLGFSLQEIQELMDLYDYDKSEVTQLKVLIERIQIRKLNLENQKKDLEEMLKELEGVETNCKNLLRSKQSKV